MTESATASPSAGSILGNRFRGHVERDWTEWRERHFYPDAAAVPHDAERAWITRDKRNWAGIGARPALRHLVAANVDQPLLDEIGNLRDLERLELEWPTLASDLAPLLNLTKLRFLSIDSARKLADFAPLLDLPALRTLLITNAKAMTDLAWLRGATRLEVIGIEGGMLSPYTIPSLDPLAGLPGLRAFLGVSTKLADRRLMPLAECPALEFVQIACVAPRAEFGRLHAARPDIHCDWFDPDLPDTLFPRR